MGRRGWRPARLNQTPMRAIDGVSFSAANLLLALCVMGLCRQTQLSCSSQNFCANTSEMQISVPWEAF
jgi:hypothetical protein